MKLHIDEIKKLPTFIRLDKDVGVVLRLEITVPSSEDKDFYYVRYYCDNGMWYVDIKKSGGWYVSKDPYSDEEKTLEDRKLIETTYADYDKCTGNYSVCDKNYNPIDYYNKSIEPSKEIPY